MRKEKGITLISLIITIIVMLILAVVSLSAVMGENGILSMTKNTKLKNLISEAEDIATLAIASKTIDKYVDDIEIKAKEVAVKELRDKNYTVISEVAEDKVTGINFKKYNKVLKNNDLIATSQIHSLSLELESTDEECVQYYVLIDGGYHEITYNNKKIDILEEGMDVESVTIGLSITANNSSLNKTSVNLGEEVKLTIGGIEEEIKIIATCGDIVEELILKATDILASGITKSDIGKQVEYISNGNTNITWKILHADKENVYIISDSNFENPNGSNYLTAGVNSGYTQGSAMLTDDSMARGGRFPMAKKWLNVWLNSGKNSQKVNMQAVLYMLDTSVWNDKYCNDFAEYAVGGPTIELLAASYDLYNGLTGDASVSKNIDVPNENGYSNVFDSGFASGTVWNNGNSYWVATPSSDDSSNVKLILQETGFTDWGLNYSDANGLGSSFRPVVCLRSDVILEFYESENIFKIIK